MKENIVAKSILSEDLLQITVEEGMLTAVEVLAHGTDGKPSEYPFIAPAFFDIQVNGYVGSDYSSMLPTEKIEHLVFRLAESGTAFHMPTIITNSEERIIESIDAIVQARKASSIVERAIPSIHIEGPFISPKEGARGVHNPKYIRPCDIEEFLRWQDHAEGLIKLVTLSPEDDIALDFIKKLTAMGVRIAIGHTAVDPEQIEAAVEAGATLSTHLGNGSPGMLPRLKNFLWKELSDDRLYASIIADGFHLPPYVLDTYTRVKGVDRIILTSDVASLAGSPPGSYRWCDMDVEVFADGHMGLQGTHNLAGASLLLDTCIAHLHEVTKFTLAESVYCASVLPQTYLSQKLSMWGGNPKVGDIANFTLFTYHEGDGKLNILRTQLGDKQLFSREL